MEKIDFLPERIKTQRVRRRRLIREGYLIALCVLGLAVLGFVRQGRIKEARAEKQVLEDRAANIKNQLNLLSVLQRQQADLMTMKRIDDKLGSSVNALYTMAELGRIQPIGMVLRKFDLETMAVRVPVSEIERINGSDRAADADGRVQKERIVTRVRLTITGLAPTDVDIANFIGQMSASPLFEKVNMGYAKNIEFRGRNAREFQASCYLVR